MKKRTNLAASVRQRLLNLSKERAQDFLTLLTQFAGERVLYRLSKSAAAQEFVLKGATLFVVWTGEPHRATRDVDLLGFGTPEPERLAELFRELCTANVEDDGLEFLPTSVKAEPIREGKEYVGVRVTLSAKLAAALIPLQVDIGMGDAVVPAPVAIEFPSLLDLPRPTLRIYPREAVIAEKLHAIVELGMANSRMKDYFDLWLLARRFEFSGEQLLDAVRATFQRRATPVSRTPVGLSSTFLDDHLNQTRWTAFIRRTRPLENPPSLPEVGAFISSFLVPVLLAADRTGSPPRHWTPGGPWS